jgi:dihydroorotase
MPRTLIRHGRVIDPGQALDRVMNLLIEDGRIVAYDVESFRESPGDQVIDAKGLIVAPGLIDLNAQLREPGFEEDETIESGAAAALAGGFTSIACLPETDPPIDSPAGVRFVQRQAERAKACRVHVLACVSKNREGKELAEIGSLSQAGAAGFTDAPRAIHNTELLRRALEYCSMFDKPIFSHAEVIELSQGGVMHEGVVSLVLGLSGMPAEAEDVMIGRDLRLAEATGGRLHLLNVSTKNGVDLIRRYKSRGVAITAGVSIAHLTMTDDRLKTFDANCKVNPPLRSAEHVEACIAGLADGVLDVISSGHAPRAAEKKMRELDQAPFGMAALETLLGQAITHLVRPGRLAWPLLLSKLTTNPARVLSLDRGSLAIGAPADITIIDPELVWKVDPTRFKSKSSNTPLAGAELTGRAICVLVDGEVRYQL